MTDSHPVSDMDRIGARIARTRAERGLSTTALAASAGVTRATLAGIERGTRRPTLETLAKIADGLQVRLAALVDGRGLLPPAEDLFVPGVADAEVLDVWTDEGRQVEVHRLRVSGRWIRPAGQPGARGYLTVVDGHGRGGAAATPRPLRPGVQVPFALDQPHMILPEGGPVEVVLVIRHPSGGEGHPTPGE